MHTNLSVISQRAEYRNKGRNEFAFGCAFLRGYLGSSRHKRKLLACGLNLSLGF